MSYRVFLFITESRIRLIGCNRCTHVPIVFFSTLTTCYTLLICIYSPYIRHRLYDITHYTAGFFHSVTEAYNKYIRNVILFYNTSFRPKKSYLFGPKNVLRRFTGPRFLWVFFLFFFFTMKTVLKWMLIGKTDTKNNIDMHSSHISFRSCVEYGLSVHFWGIDSYLLFDVYGECMLICKSNSFFLPVTM